MNMCLRMNCMPAAYLSAEEKALWDSFLDIVKGYRIENAIFSGSRTQLKQLRALTSNQFEVCAYVQETAGTGPVTPEYYIDYLDAEGYESLSENRSCIIDMRRLSLAGCKLLHQDNIKIYAFTSTIPTPEQLENAAIWGVDIFQNPYYYKIPG